MSKKSIDQLTQEDWDKINKIADVDFQQTVTGATIYLIRPKTTLGPEHTAMLQALYSRSPSPILFHLLKVSENGAETFMEQFYSGYGDKSIGDLGHVIVCLEGVSMLTAKAWQDSQQYAGQESSTRYVNFKNQPFLSFDKLGNPVLTEGESIFDFNQQVQENWRRFYFKYQEEVLKHVQEQNPYDEENKEVSKSDWERATKARMFDIMRAWLPAGATTSVAWYTSISHANEMLGLLRNHNLLEVVDSAQVTEKLLINAYPASFQKKVYEKTEAYKKKWFNDYYYFKGDDVRAFDATLYGIAGYRDMILDRPFKTELPAQLGIYAQVYWKDSLDFASFRDQQRNRAIIQRMGLLTPTLGFHNWYIKNLPESLQEVAKDFLKVQLEKIEQIDCNDFERQYYFPMGMKVPTEVFGPLGKMLYFVEQRAQSAVHPTLHENAYWVGNEIRKKLSSILDVAPDLVPVYINPKIGEFNPNRGRHTLFIEGKAISDE